MKTCNEPGFTQEKAANRLCFVWGAGSRPWSFTPSKGPMLWPCHTPGRVILPLDLPGARGAPCRTEKTLDVCGRRFCFMFRLCS